jgi:hypothetical protein
VLEQEVAMAGLEAVAKANVPDVLAQVVPGVNNVDPVHSSIAGGPTNVTQIV